MKNLSVRNEDRDIPCKSDVDSRLNNVPNVTTNNQTPTYSTAVSLAKLVTGEKLGAAFGEIAKAVDELIVHLSDGVRHITAARSGICNVAAIDVVAGRNYSSSPHPTVAYKTGRTKALVMAWTESASSSAYSNFLSHLFTQMSSSTSTSYSSNFCFLGVTNGNIQFPGASAVNYMVIWFN